MAILEANKAGMGQCVAGALGAMHSPGAPIDREVRPDLRLVICEADFVLTIMSTEHDLVECHHNPALGVAGMPDGPELS